MPVGWTEGAGPPWRGPRGGEMGRRLPPTPPCTLMSDRGIVPVRAAAKSWSQDRTQVELPPDRGDPPPSRTHSESFSRARLGPPLSWAEPCTE